MRRDRSSRYRLRNSSNDKSLLSREEIVVRKSVKLVALSRSSASRNANNRNNHMASVLRRLLGFSPNPNTNGHRRRRSSNSRNSNSPSRSAVILVRAKARNHKS